MRTLRRRAKTFRRPIVRQRADELLDEIREKIRSNLDRVLCCCCCSAFAKHKVAPVVSAAAGARVLFRKPPRKRRTRRTANWPLAVSHHFKNSKLAPPPPPPPEFSAEQLSCAAPLAPTSDCSLETTAFSPSATRLTWQLGAQISLSAGRAARSGGRARVGAGDINNTERRLQSELAARRRQK